MKFEVFTRFMFEAFILVFTLCVSLVKRKKCEYVLKRISILQDKLLKCNSIPCNRVYAWELTALHKYYYKICHKEEK